MRSPVWGVALVLGVVAGCGGKGGGSTGGDGGPAVTVKDVSFIRVSRGIQTTEPEGLRNLEVLVGTTRTAITSDTSLETAVCRKGCAVSGDKSRLLYLDERNDGETFDLYSVPLSSLQPNLGAKVKVNEKPLVQATFKLFGGRVLFLQLETAGGAAGDGGVTPPTFSLASAAIGGGDVKKYRRSTFLTGSPFAVGAGKVVFGETLGAASQLNVYVYDAENPNSDAEPVYRYQVEGSGEFGGEVMAVSPNGGEVMIATQIGGNKIFTKVATNGSTQQAQQLRVGPVECAAAGASEICLVQSELFYSGDGSKVYFLGGRQVGIPIVNQLYAVNASLQGAPQALSSFRTEIHSLTMNRARNRVVFSTESGLGTLLKRNYALFAQDFNGSPLSGNPEKIVDDADKISFHYQEPAFLE